MRQTLKNSKGFTLVELLVVIAILGVLAVIAFQAFSGVIENARAKTDQQTAGQIVKAVKMLVIDTSQPNIIGGNIYQTAGNSTTAPSNPYASTKSADLIKALQSKLYTIDRKMGSLAHGPYLERIGGAADYEGYKPQSQAYRDGGYSISIRSSTREVTVKPVATVGEAIITIDSAAI